MIIGRYYADIADFGDISDIDDFDTSKASDTNTDFKPCSQS